MLAVGAAERQVVVGGGTQKEIPSQTDLYPVNLSSETYVFEDKLSITHFD